MNQSENFSERIEELMGSYLEEVKKQLQIEFTQNNRWLRTKEACEYLSISPSQLHILKTDGIISCTKLGGTNYYDRLEIDEYLEANKIA